MPLKRLVPNKSQSPRWEPYRKNPPTPPPTAHKQKNNSLSQETADVTTTAPSPSRVTTTAPSPSRVWSWGVLADNDPELAHFRRKSEAQQFNNTRIRKIATQLAGPLPNPIGPHHKNHAVGPISISIGGNDYSQLGRYFQLVSSAGNILHLPTIDEHANTS